MHVLIIIEMFCKLLVFLAFGLVVLFPISKYSIRELFEKDQFLFKSNNRFASVFVC